MRSSILNRWYLAVLFAAAPGGESAGAEPSSARRNAERLWSDAPQPWGRPVYYQNTRDGGAFRTAATQDPTTPDRGNMGMMPGGQGPMGTMPESGASADIGADFAGPQTSQSASTDFGADFAAQPTSFGDRASSDSAAASAAANASATRDAGSIDSSSADYTLGNQSDVRATSDAGDLLSRSTSNTGIVVNSRNPVSNDPRIRGYRYAQIRSHANGAFYFPTRPDLDTALSKIDSSVILDVVTIKGPYTVRAGAGFAFVDISLRAVPRYDDGYHSGGQIGSTYNTNGEQFSGNTLIEGGSCDWGYRFGYSHRTGNDYNAGDGTDVAASFNVRNIEGQFSFDVGEYSRLDVGFMRLDGTGIDMPGQVNNIRFQMTDAVNVRYVADDGESLRFATDSWYNRSRFQGTLAGKDTTTYGFLPVTNGDVMSTGFRSLLTVGAADDHQVTIGSDYGYILQEYLEDFSDDGVFDFGIPRTRTSDAGLFADTKLVVSDRLTTRIGARVDWVSVGFDESQNEIVDPTNRNYTLWSAFVTGDYRLNDEWSASAGFGAGQRAPTATDLYGNIPYLGILQYGGLFYADGNPDLSPEYARQFDVGLKGEYQDFRCGAAFFYSRIDDFITYDGFEFGATTENHDASLVGGDAYFEADLSDRWTAFGNVFYVEGRDRFAAVPLWGIPPLQTTLGLRVKGEAWGLEWATRVVAPQDRVNSDDFLAVRELETAGFYTMDVSGFYKLTDDFTLTGGVLNLLDRTYIEHLNSRADFDYNDPRGVLRPGRSFYFGGVWTF